MRIPHDPTVEHGLDEPSNVKRSDARRTSTVQPLYVVHSAVLDSFWYVVIFGKDAFQPLNAIGLLMHAPGGKSRAAGRHAHRVGTCSLLGRALVHM